MIYNLHLPLDAYGHPDPASGGEAGYQADSCQELLVFCDHATVDLKVLEDPPLCWELTSIYPSYPSYKRTSNEYVSSSLDRLVQGSGVRRLGASFFRLFLPELTFISECPYPSLDPVVDYEAGGQDARGVLTEQAFPAAPAPGSAIGANGFSKDDKKGGDYNHTIHDVDLDQKADAYEMHDADGDGDGRLPTEEERHTLRHVVILLEFCLGAARFREAVLIHPCWSICSVETGLWQLRFPGRRMSSGTLNALFSSVRYELRLIMWLGSAYLRPFLISSSIPSACASLLSEVRLSFPASSGPLFPPSLASKLTLLSIPYCL
jgi:hypothetical protein